MLAVARVREELAKSSLIPRQCSPDENFILSSFADCSLSEG
ncbi:hypothetical protein A2U01_0089856, partial [Trifolium medium]|nr:hypothetical protein [Trifolium medium]